MYIGPSVLFAARRLCRGLVLSVLLAVINVIEGNLSGSMPVLEEARTISFHVTNHKMITMAISIFKSLKIQDGGCTRGNIGEKRIRFNLAYI